MEDRHRLKGDGLCGGKLLKIDNDGDLCIESDIETDDGDQQVFYLTPHQVEGLIEWWNKNKKQ